MSFICVSDVSIFGVCVMSCCFHTNIGQTQQPHDSPVILYLTPGYLGELRPAAACLGWVLMCVCVCVCACDVTVMTSAGAQSSTWWPPRTTVGVTPTPGPAPSR